MLAFYALIAAVILYVAYTATSVYRQGVPGPWYTNVTSLPLKYQEFARNRRLWIHSLHQCYGPAVRLSPTEVSFASAEGMKEIYQSSGSGYEKTEFYDLFQQYGYRTMFTMLGRHEHAQRRKLFAERYSMTHVSRPEVAGGIQARAMSVIEQCRAAVHAQKYMDIYVTLHCYALDCASHFLFNPGGIDSLNNPKDMRLMQELSYHDSLRQRLVEHYWPKLNRIACVFSPKTITLSKEWVLENAQSSKANSASLIQKLQLDNKGASLTTIQSAAECMDHMAAGIDTTGDALCFLMYELSLPRSAVMQQTLHEELAMNPLAKLDDLPYLDAVVKEGLRLFPPIPMSLPRYVPEGGRSIVGYSLPAGSIVSCQAYSLHLLNPDVFPDAEKFLPDRWLQTEGAPDRNRLLFAFGAGGRGCIGKNLALVEMKTLLKEVYSRYSTRVAEGKTFDMSIDDQMIASRPKDQTCPLVFEERNPQT